MPLRFSPNRGAAALSLNSMVRGATGPLPLTALSAWVTGTAYVSGPPASFVSNGGSSYACLVSHTAGTFATDLAAGKWGIVATAGLIADGFFEPRTRTVTAAGDVTISAADDDVVYVAKTSPASTNVNFPTAAARIAAGGQWIGIKNNHANPALYPLTPVRAGSDTIDDTATPLPQDSNRIRWYRPTAANDWEIQSG